MLCHIGINYLLASKPAKHNFNCTIEPKNFILLVLFKYNSNKDQQFNALKVIYLYLFVFLKWDDRNSLTRVRIVSVFIKDNFVQVLIKNKQQMARAKKRSRCLDILETFVCHLQMFFIQGAEFLLRLLTQYLMKIPMGRLNNNE